MTDINYTVVIVTYNREQLLRECVDCVRNQSIPPKSIIIVNNASTDNTNDYLNTLKIQGEIFDIINLSQNLGGSGGFAKGIARALEKDVDCVLLIDDDAIIIKEYMEKILQKRQQYPKYKAFAGTVKVDGIIDTSHRRNLLRIGLKSKKCDEQKYVQAYFLCDIASFCGMVVDVNLIQKIGLPHEEYFIWYDDTEYSLRIHQYTRFLVVTGAELNHKTKLNIKSHPRRYDWKEYYAIRNRLLMVREHGNLIDRIVNFVDLFIHVIFRNWLFGVIRRDGYDWKYEKDLLKKAIKNFKQKTMENIILKRER